MKDKILNAKNYYDIFTKEHFKEEYIKLITQFHPDKNKDKNACDVAAKLNQLYAEAKTAMQNNTWGTSKQIIQVKRNDKTVQIKYRYSYATEVGSAYVGDIIVVFTFNNKKYFDNYVKSISKISYRDNKMKDYFSRFIPIIKDKFKALDNTYYIVLEKTPEVYPLSLVKDIFIAKEHAAWIMTRLMNICVLLSMNNLVHCGINIDSCFVSLRHHGLLLLGGWHFGTEQNKKMIGTTKEIFDNLPPLIKDTKIANSLIDIESSKMIVKQLLNCNTYSKLEKVCGKDMAEFLSYTSTKSTHNKLNPLDELKKWEEVRNKTFPEHKFIKIKEMTPDDVFK